MLMPPKMKLGKKPAVINPKTPCLMGLLETHLPVVPAAVNWGKDITTWKMWRNGDQLSDHAATIPGLGDCTAVAVASAIRIFTHNRGGEIELTDDDVVGIYAMNGFDPKNPTTTDNGASEDEVLNNWITKGYNVSRQTPDVLTTFGSVDPKNTDAVKRAIYAFGGLYIGLSLPDYSVYAGAPWVAPTKPYTIDGGHAVFVHGYDEANFYLNTWGDNKVMSKEFFTLFCDEAYGLLSRDWLDVNGMSPAHEDLSQLAAEMKAIV